MKKELYDHLDKFFAEKVISDVNRDTFLVCNLHDRPNKVTTSLVFLRDWDSLETDQYNMVVIEGKGAVVTLPCYWVSIPKELVMAYMEYIVDSIYDNEYTWLKNSESSDSSDPSGGYGCPCAKV